MKTKNEQKQIPRRQNRRNLQTTKRSKVSTTNLLQEQNIHRRREREVMVQQTRQTGAIHKRNENKC